ncbi:MAG TPA: hypothetical protein VFZ58_05050 [Candidatus Saccharimonadales bacterium]
MKKISTKALVTVLVITAFSLQFFPILPAQAANGRTHRQIERAQRHHDRKLELRAATLGITPDQLKRELKELRNNKDLTTEDQRFDALLKSHGFKTRHDFYIAFQGKVRDELHKRGLSEAQIQQELQKRFERFKEEK